MIRHVKLRPKAHRDLAEIALHISKQSPDAALRFFDAVETACRELADSPGIGAAYVVKNPRLSGLKARRVPGFPNHVIFYLVHDDRVEVVRILQGSRDIEAALDEV